jgi:tetratricopeptide (TPR) repeat protein
MAAKLDKQELTEPDQLQRFFIALRALAAEHQKRILAGAGVLVAVLLLASGWFVYDQRYEGKAQKHLFQVAESRFKSAADPANGEQGAIEGYKEVIAQYPRSDAALLAHYKLASLYAGRKEYDLAIPVYEAFLDKAKGSGDLVSLAHGGLGFCFEAKKDYEKALAQYELARKADKSLSLEGLHLSSIARVYEGMNNAGKAAEYYKQALDKTKDPMMELYLKRKLALLG